MKIYTGDEGGYLKMVEISNAVETKTLLKTASILKILKQDSKLFILTKAGIMEYCLESQSSTELSSKTNIIGFGFVDGKMAECTIDGVVTVDGVSHDFQMKTKHFVCSENQLVLAGDTIKIFDASFNQKWKSMNMHDELDLAIPFRINTISMYNSKLLVGNGEFLQIYEPPRRKPHKHINLKSPIKSLVETATGYNFCDSKGGCFDLDADGKIIKGYKGHKGCVVQAYRKEEMCVTISLDRYLRIFMAGIQVHEVYMKQRFSCMLVEGDLTDADGDQDQDDSASDNERERSEDDEELWDKIEKVGKAAKKQKISK